MYKKLTIFMFVFLSCNIMAKENIWLNDLNCTSFIEDSACKEIHSSIYDIELSKYHKLTFDNQLKKITFLMKKDRLDIASKKYDYFFSMLKDNISTDKMEELELNKSNIYNLLLNYSKSSSYVQNPKYKLR